MRYRAMDADRDYTFGRGRNNFLVNSPATVAQAVLTRLLLMTDEWFLDLTEGTPYATQILGKYTEGTRDMAIRSRILDTQGVTGIVAYNSIVDREQRTFTVSATIDTLYGQTQLQAVL